MDPTFSSLEAALALLRTGDLSGGAKALEGIIATAPDNADAHYRLGNVYRDLLRLSDAERELRTVMDLRPNDAKVHSALGIVLVESGRVQEALTVHAEAMRLDPANTTIATNWLM